MQAQQEVQVFCKFVKKKMIFFLRDTDLCEFAVQQVDAGSRRKESAKRKVERKEGKAGRGESRLKRSRRFLAVVLAKLKNIIFFSFFHREYRMQA